MHINSNEHHNARIEISIYLYYSSFLHVTRGPSLQPSNGSRYYFVFQNMNKKCHIFSSSNLFLIKKKIFPWSNICGASWLKRPLKPNESNAKTENSEYQESGATCSIPHVEGCTRGSSVMLGQAGWGATQATKELSAAAIDRRPDADAP